MKAWLLSAILVLGCGGKAVDLGHSGWSDAEGSSDDPSSPRTLYQSIDRVVAITVDDNTLYALIRQDDELELTSCPLDDCPRRRTTLFRGPRPIFVGNRQYLEPLVLAGGRLFWMMRQDDQTTDLASCAAAGCEQLDFVRNLTFPPTSDGQQIYWLEFDHDSGSASLMTLLPGGHQAQLVRSDVALPITAEPGARGLLVNGEYAYFIGGNDSIYRLPKDGSEEPELLVQDEDLWTFSVDGEQLIYTTDVLTGRVVRCPLSGCREGGATLSDHQWYPDYVQAVGDEIFWLNGAPRGAAHGSEALRSCQLPDCAAVKDWGIEFARHDESGGATVPALFVAPRSIVWLEKPDNFASAIRQVAR